MELLKENGYPSDKLIDLIIKYKPTKELPIEKFITDFILAAWKYNGYSFDGTNLELHTYGWSGNEEIISAMHTNFCLREYPLQETKWERGGHYYFVVLKHGIDNYNSQY